MDSFVSKCPSCGYELRDNDSATSVKMLYKNIQNTESDKEIIRLIKIFPIPNNKEDILEFMILASSNFNEDDYISHYNDENSISSAWLSKIEQCHKKAHLSLENEDILRVDNIYNSINERVTKAKQKLNNKYKSQQLDKTVKEFNKSKFRIILILFSILSVILCVAAFNDGKTISGIIAIFMVILFLISFLMGSGVINERVKNFRLIPAIIAFILLAPFFLFTSNQYISNNTDNNVDNYQEEIENISWSSLKLGKYIPDFGVDKARLISNSEENLYLDYYDIEKSRFESYVDKCKEDGYSIDSKSDDESYEAWSSDGYYLKVLYSDLDDKNSVSIRLEDPIEKNTIQWPNSNLGKSVPKPKYLIGEVTSESDDLFSVYLTSVEPSYFSEYVTLCMDNGFNKDYFKSETYYSAENDKGLSLTVEFMGNNTLYISIDQFYL